MNRRHFLKALAGGAALALLPTVAENADEARRYWALDRTIVPRDDVYWANGWHMRGDFSMATERFDTSMEPFPGLKILTDVRVPNGIVLFTDHTTVLTTPQIEALLREQWLRQRNTAPILL